MIGVNGDLSFNGEYIIPDVLYTFQMKEAKLLVSVTDYDEKRVKAAPSSLVTGKKLRTLQMMCMRWKPELTEV